MGDLNLRGAAQSGWGVLESLDLLSRRLRHVSLPVHGLGSANACSIEPDIYLHDAAMGKRFEECGMIMVVLGQVAEARTAFLANDRTRGSVLLSAAEAGLKATARRWGLYRLLYLTGGEEPTIWAQVASLGAEVHAMGGSL